MKQVDEGTLSLQGIKVVVSLVGRADVLDRGQPVAPSVLKFREALNRVDMALLLLVGTPLPWPGDQEQVVRKLHRTTGVFRALCHGKTTMDFIKATQHFVSVQGVNLAMVGPQKLTTAALQSLDKSIMGKINCAKLRHKYQELKQITG